MDIWALSDLCTPWCLFVVATLRIAELLNGGISKIEDLAKAAGADADSLERVLRHLVGKGVFEETARGEFALNEAARGLLDPGLRLGLDLNGIGGRMANSWSTLLTAVRTGAPAYHTVFGRPFWEDLQAHPEVAASFDELMGPAGHGVPNPDIRITGGWESVRMVVDVGGGTGALLAEVLRAYPAVKGVLVDFPATVAKSSAIFQAVGVIDRVTTVGQNFFDPLPTDGDLYFLNKVLDDWPDREAAAILKRCAEAARPAGRVVLLSGVSPDGNSAPSAELLMLVLVGGKARSLTEFRQLARPVGLEVVNAERQPSGRFVVECRPI